MHPVFPTGIKFDSNLFEEQLCSALPPETAPPQHLHKAMRYAVLSPGKRLRPRLLFAVAEASAAQALPEERLLASSAACAIEVLHCASLVHDDLPCFDDADSRRGRPTVHRLFGESMAVLVGDALLTRAFEIVAEARSCVGDRAMDILHRFARFAGSRDGIIGGQSLELGAPLCQEAELTLYQEMKTGALFRLAAEVGAITVGATDVAAWGRVGRNLGLAFQLLDDLLDVHGDARSMGKPIHRDATLRRPNASLLLGPEKLRAMSYQLLEEAKRLAAGLTKNPRALSGFFVSMLDVLKSAYHHLPFSAPDAAASAADFGDAPL